MEEIEMSKIQEIKTDKKRYILLFISLMTILALSDKIYSYLFTEEPTVSSFYGEVEIYVNGMWVPLKAGTIITPDMKIRVKEGAYVKIGEEIITSESEEAVLRIGEGKLEVEEGRIALTDETKAELAKSEAPEKAEVLQGRIVNVSVGNVKNIIDDVNYLDSRTTLIKVETENIHLLQVGGATYKSDADDFQITLSLKDGENIIEIVGLDENRNIIDKKTVKIYVDTTTLAIDKGMVKYEFY